MCCVTSLRVAAPSPAGWKGGEGTLPSVSLWRGRVWLHVGYCVTGVLRASRVDKTLGCYYERVTVIEESDSALRRKFQFCMQERTLSIRQPIMLCFKALVDQSVKTEAIKMVERLNIIQVKRNADVGWVSLIVSFRFASSCILLDEQKLGIIWFWPFRNRVSPTFSVLMTDCQ